MHWSRHPLSLRARLTLSMALLALGVCATLAVFTFRAASGTIQRDADRTVDAVAEAKKTLLVRTLTAQFERLGVFVDNMNRCSTEECLRGDARRVLAREKAEAAVVVRPGAAPLEVGTWEGLDPLPAPIPGVIAQPFRDRAGVQRYVMTRTDPNGAGIRVVWRGSDLDPLFARVPALGESGETFVADPKGYFLTTPRYEGPMGHIYPIRMSPMLRCLAGEDGSAEDLDYRGVLIIHGFRYIKELGGGCVMAHIDLHEARAPVRKLEREILALSAASAVVAIALAAYLAGRLTRVISALGQYARKLRGGDLTAALPPVNGTKEQEALAATLRSMAKSLYDNEQNRERFMGILAHDLKTPLATISLAADFLEKGEAVPPSTLRHAATIKNSAHRMSRMISDLLDFARSRSPEGLPVRPTQVDLGQLMASAVETLRSTQADRAIELRSEGDLTVRCDSDRALQVVTNLIENAFRYGSPERPVTVTVRGREKDVELAVHSWGAPIPADEIDTIFDPFRRGRGAVASAHGGLGLGLFVVDQIVKAHGGRVEVTSSEAEGTTFTTYWPRG
ncbi:MAG TPA: HAMP domain-containing sensor histidine kinase [Polyangiaceae bacterium]|nr:HAMP domain-containing sensor histidine kinase [Polyangiaceae bacterium]